MQKTQDEAVKNLYFPLALALFTLIVYIGNDLVLPAMLRVTQDFGVGPEWAPTSMSAYLLGGALLASIWGPMSDQLGRRKVFLVGAVFFVVCCLLILATRSIEQFMALRVLQGTALTLIAAVGFATVQEAYAETQAVKVMALMANISLLAPLLGPVIGAVMIEYVSWHWGFVAIAVCAALSVVGLYKYMPETVDLSQKQSRSIGSVLNDFLAIYTNKRFMILALSGPIIGLPVMLWISLSPVFLIEELKLSNFGYGLSQVPVLGSLIFGNLLLAKLVDRYPLGKTVVMGFILMGIGAFILLLGLFFTDYILWSLIGGMSVIAVGEGLSYAVMYRFALVASDIAKGTVAAAMATVVMVFFSVMIELTKHVYLLLHFTGLWLMCALCVLAFGFLSYPLLLKIMKEREAAVA